MGNPNAGTRNTEIASLLESFLDDNANSLSPDMFSELDSLAEQIDEEVKILEEEIEGLESDKEELQNQVIELEGNS